MAYCDGESLRQKIERGPLKLDEGIETAIQISNGLKKAHESGIIHRDVKPANVIITTDGQAKIVDFGLAKLRGRTKLTKERTTLGTIEYMSPEQARGEEVDHRTDIWSLGCVLYEMVTGKTPFKGDYEQAVVYSILNTSPDPVTALRSGVPMELERIITKTMEKNAEDRYQHVEDLIVDLRRGRPSGVLSTIRQETRKVETGRNATIAVLPFTNLSGNKENEYFSDGLTEQITNALTRLAGLRVIARTSAFAFRGKEQDVREIGARLAVEHILKGTVQQSGTRIRITTQLVNVSDGCHIWSERYDREMTDIFAIQDEISASVAENLQAKVHIEASPFSKPTSDMQAYTLFLKGRHHLCKWTPEGFDMAKHYLEEAIGRDDQFALAYDSLAELHWFVGFLGILPPREAFSQGIWAALRALQIDDTLAETHALLGMYRKELDYNWVEVERETQLAVNLKPDSPVVLLRRALSWLMPHGRMGEAVADVERALQSDPLSVSMQWWLSVMLWLARRYDDGIERARMIIELDADYYPGHFLMGVFHIANRNNEQAIASLRSAVELSGGAPQMLGWLGFALSQAGNPTEAHALLDHLKKMALNSHVSPTALAWIQLGLGDHDEALKSLERAIDDRDPWVVPIKSYPILDPIRDDPRFLLLLQSMSLKS
ncbi:MAG: hypothetical protein HW389_3541 [Bacteroidetes bacterium]|nr:hypothetical protein [Bacteroidota bacterium]